ncbi:hypothetical protein SAMN05444583_1199 [Rhodococcus maanshanensis]|uniref:Uncharacterized protein n=1 Tax=Rhodococcus maanshanensis TaxID=183556 RepID=A0A1H7UR46_9NOCA|nr:hypothetical protein SAMN05444583_1199 [Rhodococcus maanshanensis]
MHCKVVQQFNTDGGVLVGISYKFDGRSQSIFDLGQVSQRSTCGGGR